MPFTPGTPTNWPPTILFAVTLILPLWAMWFFDTFDPVTQSVFDACVERLASLILPLYLLLKRYYFDLETVFWIFVEWCDDWWYYHGDFVEVVVGVVVKVLFALFVLVIVLTAVVIRQPDNTRWMSDRNEMSPWAVAEEAKVNAEAEDEVEKVGGREPVSTVRHMFS